MAIRFAKTWTESAEDCLRLDGDCSRCNTKIESQKCVMKQILPELLPYREKSGHHNPYALFAENQKPIIEAFLEYIIENPGCFIYDLYPISDYFGISHSRVYKIIDKLEKNRYVKQNSHFEDRNRQIHWNTERII